MAIPFVVYAQTESDSQKSKVQQTIPIDYETLLGEKSALDLVTPSNIKTEAEYDDKTGNYIIHTKIGENEVGVPFILTPQEYNNWQLRKSMQSYLYKKNTELAKNNEKQPFNILDMNFALGPL